MKHALKRKVEGRLISLRKLPDELDRVIRFRARERGVSLNKAVIGLLEESLGRARAGRRHEDLDALAGTWTAAEAREFDRSLRGHRKPDPELWA